MVIVIISLIVVALAGYAIAKNYDAKIVLFAAGFALMICAILMGNPIVGAKLSSGSVWFDPLVQVKSNFIKQFGGAGIIIMVLFGFSGYMTHIGANNAAVNVMTKPISYIKSPYILVPLIFWLGTLLSLVVPSASSLAVILMATLYPIMRAAGMSALTAGGVIATTATIAPTPIGHDNIKAAEMLGFGTGVPEVSEYVFGHHAMISIPVIIFMGLVHYFWQKYMDKREGAAANVEVDEERLEKEKNAAMQDLPPAYYGIFPILPLILIIMFALVPGLKTIKLSIVEITFFCFILAFIVEVIRKRNIPKLMKEAGIFFTGMGTGFSQVVVLIVAAGTMVAGLQAIGAIALISNAVQGSENAGTGLMLIFSGVTALITFISGSGNAVFYSFIELIPPIADSAGVSAIMVALPMQLTSNLIRAVSPVSAVVIIVASVMNVNPLRIVKRTCVPLILGFVLTMIISVIRYS